MFAQSRIEFEFEYSSETRTSYFVCSTPRCGSSLICQALQNTGLAGAPTEYFDANIQERFYQHWQIDTFTEYLSLLRKTKTGPNGVFGTKTHFNQFNRCFGIESLPAGFPNPLFIWIRRTHLIEQAVSYAMAIQSDKWSAAHAGNGTQPEYRFEQIASLKTRLENEQSRWESFFKSHSIAPLVLTYEDFSNDLYDAAIRCLEYLDVGIADAVSIEPVTLKKQAGAQTREWIERFAEDVASQNRGSGNKSPNSAMHADARFRC